MLTRVLHVALRVAACIALILMFTSHVVAQTFEGGYKIFRPDGPGPHPSVVFLCGCSGFARPRAQTLRTGRGTASSQRLCSYLR